jgi:hypothetical protein
VQRFIQLVPGGNGIIYAIQADGTMLWYRHTGWQTGAATWANNGTGHTIGSGWNAFSNVLASEDGQVFGFMPDGTISWYKYVCTDLNTGAGSWAGGGSGQVIGSGFNSYPRIIGGWEGQFFAIDTSGNLWHYQYLAGNGSSGAGAWANGGAGLKIGGGFSPLIRAWTEPNGVIYGVRQSGALDWYRYLGSGAWANGGSGVVIGSGWGEGLQKTAFAGGSGSVYSVALDSDQLNGTDWTLEWYRLTNSQTVTAASGGVWANRGTAQAVGSGFSFESTAALQGYAVSQSVAQGGTQQIAVSTTFSSFTGSIVRLAPAAGDPVTVQGPSPYSGQLQLLASGYRANGCGWQPAISLSVPATWPSGIYAALLQSEEGRNYYAPFVIRPSSPSAPVAFLMPANTYHAYNAWAGHSRYTLQDGVNPVTLTFQRPSNTVQVDPSAVTSHTLYNDLFLLRWMSGNGVSFDCYCDSDLDASGSWLASYKALVLGGHHEYWSDNMRANLVTYLEGGGRLISPGGNALYERATFGAGQASLTWSPVGNRDIFINHGKPESQIVGAEYNTGVYLTFVPYQVEDAPHFLLTGTGLGNGARFGAAGYNGAASGWEVNGPIDAVNVVGAPTLLAQGTGQSGNGAAMVYIDRASAGGGWVFAANSIAFCGSVPGDAAIHKILTNVFAAAVA